MKSWAKHMLLLQKKPSFSYMHVELELSAHAAAARTTSQLSPLRCGDYVHVNLHLPELAPLHCSPPYYTLVYNPAAHTPTAIVHLLYICKKSPFCMRSFYIAGLSCEHCFFACFTGTLQSVLPFTGVTKKPFFKKHYNFLE